MFNSVEEDSIIETYTLNNSLLGPYPPATKEAIYAIELMREIIRSSGELKLGGDVDDQGYIAVSVLHGEDPGSDDLFLSFGFSGGERSRENFDRIQSQLKRDGLNLLINRIQERTGRTPYFYFGYKKVPEDRRSCGEPKALKGIARQGRILKGYACMWISDNFLTTPYRLNISFIPSNEAFMTPCDLCQKNFDLVNQDRMTVEK